MENKTTWGGYAEKGDGVHFQPSPPNAAEMRRILMLVEMNNRAKKYRGRRSKKGMLELAAEYEEKKMPRMAEGLRAEAYAFRRTRRVRDKIKVTDS